MWTMVYLMLVALGIVGIGFLAGGWLAGLAAIRLSRSGMDPLARELVASLIKPLIAGAEAASRRMIETAPTLPSLRHERQKERDMARQPELAAQPALQAR